KFCDPQTSGCAQAVPCEPACPAGFMCLPSGVCAGGPPTGLVLDVKTVKVSGTITLNGAASTTGTSCPGSPTDYKARVSFHEVNHGYDFEQYVLCKDSGFDFQGVIFPGTYSVSVYGGHYSGFSNLPFQDYVV